jgi:ATP-binding cassette subfamily C (CFTR/MRP) protein 1
VPPLAPLSKGIFVVVLFAGPIAVAVFCFGSFSIAGNQLSPASAYAALAYFSLLRFPMSFLPMLITMIINALVALARIQGFLVREEATQVKVRRGHGLERVAR